MGVGWVDAGNPTPSGVSLGLLGFATQPTIASISAYFSAIHCRGAISAKVGFSLSKTFQHNCPPSALVCMLTTQLLAPRQQYESLRQKVHPSVPNQAEL